jgi:hypothetical protein
VIYVVTAVSSQSHVIIIIVAIPVTIKRGTFLSITGYINKSSRNFEATHDDFCASSAFSFNLGFFEKGNIQINSVMISNIWEQPKKNKILFRKN